MEARAAASIRRRPLEARARLPDMLTSLSQNGCGMAKTMETDAGPCVPTCLASGVRRNSWLVGGGLMDLHPRVLGTKAAYLENVDVWDTQLAESPSGGFLGRISKGEAW